MSVFTFQQDPQLQAIQLCAHAGIRTGFVPLFRFQSKPNSFAFGAGYSANYQDSRLDDDDEEE